MAQMRGGARGVACAVVMLGATTVNLARAESLLQCFEPEIVEIFPGTEDCPNAQYVTLAPNGQVNGVGAYSPISVDAVTPGYGSSLFGTLNQSPYPPPFGSRYTIGTPEAQAIFGIPFDGMATGAISVPDGELRASCYGSDIVYGAMAGATAPALVRGQALKFIGGAWTLGVPAPENLAGDVGSFDAGAGICVADGGMGGDAGGLESGVDAGDDAGEDAGSEDGAWPSADATADGSPVDDGAVDAALDASLDAPLDADGVLADVSAGAVEGGATIRDGEAAPAVGPSADESAGCGCQMPSRPPAGWVAFTFAVASCAWVARRCPTRRSVRRTSRRPRVR